MMNQPNHEISIKADPRSMQFKKVFDSDGFQRSLATALPKHIRPDHMIRVVLAAMQNTPRILECHPDSVLLSVMRAASFGLEPDGGILGHGYLVPYWSGKNKRYECQFIPGYRGLVHLARNSGDVKDVWAEVVYEHDKFQYTLGLDQTLTHVRNDDVDDPGEMKYAYAVARFSDGERKFVVMNRREIVAIKTASNSKNNKGEVVGPWNDHEPEMWKKTAVRRLSKMLPLSPDVVQAVGYEGEDPTSVVVESLGVANIANAPEDEAPPPTTLPPAKPESPEVPEPPSPTEPSPEDQAKIEEALASAAGDNSAINEVYQGWSNEWGDNDPRSKWLVDKCTAAMRSGAEQQGSLL